MKGLILKDLYNISHNLKSMLFILVFFAFSFIPFSSIQGYICACTILCSMMVITTFSFDDNSKWTRYAVVMPISRQNVVAAKFAVLILFSTLGAACGIVIGAIGGVIAKKLVINAEGIGELLLWGLIALVLAEVIGSLSIPLVFKFGAERGRILIIVSYLIPVAIIFLIYQALTMLGVTITEKFIFILLCCSPLLILIWNYVMYKISCNIFMKQEF